MALPMVALYAIILAVVLIEGALIIGLIKGFYDLRRRIDEIMIEKKRAPVFLAYDIAGRRVTSSDLIGQPFGMLFVAPSSDACRDAIANLAPIKDRTGDNLFILCHGSQADCRQLLGPVGTDARTVVDDEGDLHRLFHVQVVPTILVMDEEHRITTEGKIVPADEVEALTQQTVAVGAREG